MNLNEILRQKKIEQWRASGALRLNTEDEVQEIARLIFPDEVGCNSQTIAHDLTPKITVAVPPEASGELCDEDNNELVAAEVEFFEKVGVL